ncbi:MAG: RagB/SusD family nutrient uptake outer membrane protein [Gemmatimonadetes bacterium]|nr:RagB/SusD family nutrient uptake outer membrane protein [Gemmatimonadota bacterium]
MALTTRARWAGKIGSIAAMGAVLVTLGCQNLDVPNYTSADANLLDLNPDASVVNLMATGLLRGIRANHEGLETYGRNAYNLDPTEVRSVTVPLIGPIASGGYWPYSDIRNSYSILSALDKVPDLAVSPTGMSAVQKEAVRGYVKTIMAYHYHAMLRVRYSLGGFIDVNRDKFGPLAPWVNGKAVLDHIVALLDTAQTHLLAGGTAFTFPMTRGFQTAQAGAAFNTPATFRQFNRALKARVEVYAATWDVPNAATHWNNALTALALTWVSPATTPPAGPPPVVALATLDIGPKHTYGPASADGTNGLLDATGRQRFAHPSLETDAQIQSGGVLRDARLLRKTIDMIVFKGILGLSSHLRWNISGTGSGQAVSDANTPIPIIRNEELILLRAEANIGRGNNSVAIRDINLIRVNSGVLNPIGDPYVPTVAAPTLLDELLYEKRYSLVYEFGHRWVDLARYGKLLTLPRDQPTHRIWPSLPFDIGECDFRRDQNLAGCPLGGEGGI